MKAIVNYSTVQYKPGQDRLKQSLIDYEIDLFLFDPKTLPESPSHKDNPYAFKIYAIQKVRDMGYTQILWLDASLYAVKDPEPVFQWLTEKGIFMEEAGHWAGTWSPDYVLKYFGVTKEEAMTMPMFSAGFTGLDFTNPISIEFFAEWREAMLNGMFKGDWKTSRHDMSSASIIANKRGLFHLYSKGGTFFAYVGNGYSTPKETAVFHLQGIV